MSLFYFRIINRFLVEWRNNNRFSVFALIFHLRRKGETTTAALFCPDLISSPDGETTIAALFYPNLSSSPNRRNNNRCFVFTLIFYLRRNGETSTAALLYPSLPSSPEGEIITASLSLPESFIFAEWRNNNRCSVLP